MKNIPCKPCDILLPDFNAVSGEKWAVIACDQFTSEPNYWENAKEIVGNSPSTLNLIIPEVYLNETDKRVPEINEQMQVYQNEVLKEYKNSIIYTERVQKDGRVKHGIVLAVDLEDYDFSKGSTSLIRATEGTVIERIPPRVKVRRGASIELPHVMLLIDDDKDTVIKPLTEKKNSFKKIYDFSLMLGGGAVSGYLVDEALYSDLFKSIAALVDDDNASRLYGNAKSKLLFAVGDGNHSLATAKTMYEEIKQKLGKEAENHPARYALVEIVNVHDEALEFEPIYRVMFGVNPEKVLKEFEEYTQTLNGNEKPQTVKCIIGKNVVEVTVSHPEKQLTVGTLQDFIDKYLKTNEGEVDYIHGENSVLTLSEKENSIGFIFSGMEKNQLFKTVIFDGALPRKTFSIGHAHDKRYYIECRKIVK